MSKNQNATASDAIQEVLKQAEELTQKVIPAQTETAEKPSNITVVEEDGGKRAIFVTDQEDDDTSIVEELTKLQYLKALTKKHKKLAIAAAGATAAMLAFALLNAMGRPSEALVDDDNEYAEDDENETHEA